MFMAARVRVCVCINLIQDRACILKATKGMHNNGMQRRRRNWGGVMELLVDKVRRP